MNQLSDQSLLYYLFLLALLAVTTMLPGCSRKQYASEPELVGYIENGKASFYAMKYQFSKTASGEYFNQLSLTGAHRTLFFGTKVKVTNVKSNQSVIVTINDRGPFVDGRIIDLSRSAFSRIGNTDSGVIDVEIAVVD